MRWPSRIVTVGQEVEEAIENACAGLRDVGRRALAVRVERGRVEADGALRLREAGNGADGEGHAEDLRVVAVDLILQPEVADLVEPVKAVEVDVRAIRAGSRGGTRRRAATGQRC